MTDSLTKYDKNLLFKEFEDYVKKKFDDDSFPVSVFSEKLSPFESIVKFLFENRKKSFSEIGRLLKKDRRVVWTTYRRAAKKFPGEFKSHEDDVKIPLQHVVSDDLSIAELVVFYLKDSLKLKNSQIGSLLKKDSRTIWTLYNRASKKRGGQR
jgi:hypothetical protein